VNEGKTYLDNVDCCVLETEKKCIQYVLNLFCVLCVLNLILVIELICRMQEYISLTQKVLRLHLERRPREKDQVLKLLIWR